jgi:hypothetical protein
MNKNFLDTQTGGTSDISTKGNEPQKTDLSPKEINQIKKTTEETTDVSVENFKKDSEEQEKDIQKKVEDVSNGKTNLDVEGVTAETSTTKKILEENQKEDLDVQNQDELGVSTEKPMYDEILAKNNIPQEDLISPEELDYSLPNTTLTDILQEKPGGVKVPVLPIEEYDYDEELDKEFKIIGDGQVSGNEFSIEKTNIQLQNYSKKEDENLISFEGNIIKKNRKLPESEIQRLKGEDVEPVPGYYTFKGKRYRRDADGSWYRISYSEWYDPTDREYKEKRKLKKLNVFNSRVLESNGAFQFSSENASDGLVEIFTKGESSAMYPIDYTLGSKFKEYIQKDDVEEVTVGTYGKFRYTGEEYDKVKTKITERLNREGKEYSIGEVNKILKKDGEYKLGRKKFVKKDGKWYTLKKGQTRTGGLVSRFLDRRDFGSDLVLKEVKYTDPSVLELESVGAVPSKDFLEKSIYDVILNFEDKFNNLMRKGSNYLMDVTADYLIENKDFETSPVFDFLDETLSKYGASLSEYGYTTQEIEVAEERLKQTYGDILNEEIEKQRLQWNLTTDFMFKPNAYDIENIGKRLDRTNFLEMRAKYGGGNIPGIDESKLGPFSLPISPLSASEMQKFKGLGYISLNGTLSPPKDPGIYFIGNDYATKISIGLDETAWIDKNGNTITDSKKTSLYESVGVSAGTGVESVNLMGGIDLMSFSSYDKIFGSLNISDDYQLIEDNEGANIKETEIYNLIFKNPSIASFFAESSSQLSTNGIFLALKKAYQTEGDAYSALSFMKDASRGGDLDYAEASYDEFSYLLQKELQDYNSYVSASSSLFYFVSNTEDIKSNVVEGVDKENFDKTIDSYAQRAMEALLDKSVSNDVRKERMQSLKKEITVWKENLNKTNQFLQDVRQSGVNLSNYMFNRKRKVFGTLTEMGNSKQLNQGVKLWDINNKILRLLDDGVAGPGVQLVEGDATMNIFNEYVGSSVQRSIKALQEEANQIYSQESVEAINEMSSIKTKIDNINKAIPMLQSLISGDYKESQEKDGPGYMPIGQDQDYSRVNLPDNFTLDENAIADLKLKLEILQRTKKKLYVKLDETESFVSGFFRTSTEKIVGDLAEGGDAMKPFVAALPSGEGISSFDQFGMLFESMNDRRLYLQEKLGLSGDGFKKRLNMSIDKLKDALWTDMSPLEKEYYQLVYDIRLLTPLYLNNTEATAQEQNGFFNSLMGSIYEWTFPNTSKAAGSAMMGNYIAYNISSSPRQQLMDIASTLNEFQESEKTEKGLEINQPAAQEFEQKVNWAMEGPGLDDRDFWGETIGTTLGIIIGFRNVNRMMKTGYKSIVGAEKFFRSNPAKGRSIVEKSISKFGEAYNKVMSKNKLTKHILSPSIMYGTQFEVAGTVLNQEKMGEELTFSAGFSGGVLSQAFVKGIPVLGRSLKGMTKKEYQAWIRGTFGDRSRKVFQILHKGSRGAGWGTAETMQEIGEELAHVWEDSENGRGFFKILDERFGTIDKFTKFAISCFVMGVGFGIGAKGSLAEAVSNLDKDQYEIYERVTNEIKAQHETATKEAEKVRLQYAESAINAETAINNNKQDKKDDSKDETGVSSEEQTGEESVKAESDQETSKEETGPSGVVQEEQVGTEEKVETEQKVEEEIDTKQGESQIEAMKTLSENKTEEVQEQKTEENNNVLGEKTLEIDSERTVLNYNESLSSDTNSIVYDINDETGKIGEVSGNYDNDGNFVVTSVGVNKSSGKYEQEVIESIADNVDGDIIIPKDSNVGKEMYNEDLVVTNENGDYILPNTEISPTTDQKKKRSGDGIRSLKKTSSRDGIVRMTSPFETAWNGAVEIAAKIVDAGGAVAKAVSSARNAYVNSNYYKQLKAEQKAEALQEIEVAIMQELNTEEFMSVKSTTEQSVNAALKAFQNTDVYKNADSKQKRKLTTQFKKDLQQKIDEKVELTEQDKEAGQELLDKAEKRKSKFEEKLSIKTEILKLKNKFKDMKLGQNNLQAIKRKVRDYAKKNLLKGKYTKSEIDMLMNELTQAKDIKSVERAFDKIDDLSDKKAGQQLKEQRNKTKKRISNRALRKLFTQKKGNKTKAKMDASSVDEITGFISKMGGMDAISEMNLEELQEFNDVLDGLISEGKTNFKAAEKFIKKQKRKSQGGILLGFGPLLTGQKNNNISNIQDIRDHLNSADGNFVIIGGSYYTKTDFKENEAEAIAEFKETNEYKLADKDTKEQMLEDFKSDIGSISFEGLEGTLDLKSDDFGAYYSKTPSAKSSVKSKTKSINPFEAAMDVYGLWIKAYSGSKNIVFGRKGNNSFKDFINKNIVETMPIAFARTQQQNYDIAQEHRAKLEEIFGKGTFKKGLKYGEEALRVMLFGGYSNSPKLLRSNAGLPVTVLGDRETQTKRPLTNDQAVHIYNMARNPNDKKRLIKQGVDVDAIIDYVKNNTDKSIGNKLEQYADYLMDFYNNRAVELYGKSYEKYTGGRGFDVKKEESTEEVTPEAEQTTEESVEEQVQEDVDVEKADELEATEETQEESTEEGVDVLYYPTRAEYSSDGSLTEKTAMQLIEEGASINQVLMALNPSSFQEKVGRGSLNLSIGASELFAEYNKQNTRYDKFADIIEATQTIFGNKNLAAIMEQNMGSNAFNKLKRAMSDSITGEVDTAKTALNAGVSFINSIGVLGTLAFKPQQIAKQATSFMHFWNAGIKYGLKGSDPRMLSIMTPTKNPFAATFGLVNSETREFEMALMRSAFVVDRWRGGGSSLDLDLQKAREAALKSNSSILDVMKKMYSGGGNALLLTTRMGDMAGVLFGPGGGMTFAVNMYNKFKKEGMSNEEATQRAIEIFQIEATQSQQTTQIDNLSSAQKDAVFRMVGMYRTGQSAAAKKTMRAVNEMFSGTKKSKQEKAQIASDFVYFGIFSPMLFTAVSTGFVMSALSLTGAVGMPAIARDDEDKIYERHQYDWLMDNAQSLIQGYGWGGILPDMWLNNMRDRGYFNQVPILKTIETYMNNAKSEEDLSIQDIPLLKNTEQLSELYDLMTQDKKDWRKILNKTMNWNDRYIQPGYDYGKDDAIFEYLYGEGYMEEVTPIREKDKKRIKVKDAKKAKTKLKKAKTKSN